LAAKDAAWFEKMHAKESELAGERMRAETLAQKLGQIEDNRSSDSTSRFEVEKALEIER
jgi:hypothetical protein